MFALINRLHEGVLAGTDSSTLVGIFTQLIQETKAHLEHEERLLAKTDFPGIAEHHKGHDAIIGKGLMLQARFMSGSKEPFTMKTVDQIREWLGDHVVESDRLYAEHLNAHGIF
jgi:hemerythrin-like metal-binding protein